MDVRTRDFLMELKRDSWLVKWAYLGEHVNVWSDTHTSLCALFWRSVLFTPLKLSVPLMLVGVLAVMTYQEPMQALVFFGGVAGVLTVVCAVAYVSSYVQDSGTSDQPPVVVQMLKSVKGKVCPMVTIKAER
jgi:hypothetical protein